MKYKTLFRLLVKAIGVYCMAVGAAQLINGIGHMVWSLMDPAVAGGSISWVVLYSAGSFVVGLYLFFGGKWIVDRAIPSNRPYCGECGYELSHAASDRCPECGTRFREEHIQPPTT